MADKIVNFRCSPELQSQIEAAAKADRRKVSAWVRLQVERGLERRKTKLDRSRGRG